MHKYKTGDVIWWKNTLENTNDFGNQYLLRIDRTATEDRMEYKVKVLSWLLFAQQRRPTWYLDTQVVEDNSTYAEELAQVLYA